MFGVSYCCVGVCADTEGGFVVERAVEIASAAVQHINAVSKTSKEEGQLSMSPQGVCACICL